MDLVVVPGSDRSGIAFGGPLVETGGYWSPTCLLSLCLCAWAFGFCCGCCLIRQRASTAVGWTPPAQPRDPVGRWEAISRRALNFIRSRRRRARHPTEQRRRSDGRQTRTWSALTFRRTPLGSGEISVMSLTLATSQRQ